MQQFLQGFFGFLSNPLTGALTLFVSAMMCMLVIGNPMIAWLQQKRWKKGTTVDETWTVREDTPDTHQAKTGTPSMGGLGIIASTLLACIAVFSAGVVASGLIADRGVNWQNFLLFFRKDLLSVWVLPLILLSHGVLGFVDDWSKASGRGGLQARYKFLWQLILGLVFLFAFYFWVLPFSRPHDYSIDNVGLLSFGVLLLMLIGTCNAVNLTDGIDGLAAGLAVQAGLVLYFVGATLRSGTELNPVVCLALAGACLGFLNFNKYKARVFMGDTGSLAIGATLGAAAVIQGSVFLLPFIGFIFFVEMFSVVAQVLWFKWTKRQTGEGKRLLRRAPLHHHFELAGWSEWRVVGTFWLVNLGTSVVGLWLWHAGVLPRWP